MYSSANFDEMASVAGQDDAWRMGGQPYALNMVPSFVAYNNASESLAVDGGLQRQQTCFLIADSAAHQMHSMSINSDAGRYGPAYMPMGPDGPVQLMPMPNYIWGGYGMSNEAMNRLGPQEASMSFMAHSAPLHGNGGHHVALGYPAHDLEAFASSSCALHSNPWTVTRPPIQGEHTEQRAQVRKASSPLPRPTLPCPKPEA